MAQPASHFEDLFFSTGVLPHGSVKEYFTRGHRRSRGHRRRGRRPVPAAADQRLVRQQQLRHRPSDRHAARQHHGAGRRSRRRPDVNFGQYDNDGNGFVDAFIVVHAGGGGEQTGNPNDIWSHKWTLPSALQHRRQADLRVPDHSRRRAHRRVRARAGTPALRLPRSLRHRRHVGRHRQLVPDGRRLVERRRRHPAHPSAWCKVQQGWASVTNVTTSGTHLDPGRQDQPQRPSPVEGRRRRIGVLPAREPPAHQLRRAAAGRRPADLAHRRSAAGQHRREPLQGRARSRPTASATWSWRRTAATPAIRIPAPPGTRVSIQRPRPTRSRSPDRTRACRSPPSRHRAPR